ncbi:MAG: DUF3857 domain-containing protein [Cytophagaceae bacterium]|nr:DUF3857 domain-containing protein [Cytophagaceae bacterium]
MRSLLLCVMLVFISAGFLKGQTLSFDQYKSKYPDKQAVMILKKEVVTITLDKYDSLDITLDYYSEMLHLGERTEGLAESSVSFSDFIILKELEAKTLVPYKDTYKPVKVTEFSTRNSSSSAIFFDDNKVKTFNYPGVQPGAKTILNYTQKFKEPHLLVPYYFNFYVPVTESEITIMVDKRVKLGYKVFNNNPKIKFSESVKGNFVIYKWSVKEAPEYVSESKAPSLSYSEPHIVYYIQEFKGKKRSEVMLRDVKDLYRWYYSLAIKNQKPIGDELKSLVDSLVQGVTSEKEKAKKIFYWVQNHVKYVAFEEGYGGFIPRDANLVCDRRFGDCKDMANLLVKMLNSAGLKAYHVWIGTRDIPYSYADIPSANVDNHMIAAVKLEDGYVFLDATGKYTTMDIPTAMIQGKEALIGIDADRFEIVKVPVVDADKNIFLDSTFCRIENKMLKGNGSYRLTGYNKTDYSYIINYAKNEDLKDVIKDVCTKGNNKFTLINYDIQNLNEKEKPLIINYEFTLDDYIKINANELYINLNLDKSFEKDKIDTLKRKLPYERDHKYTKKDIVIFEIPKGYSVDYLPASIHEKNNFFEVEITYKIEKSKIIYNKKITVSTLMLEKKDFNEWNKIVSKIAQAYREVVVLKQK